MTTPFRVPWNNLVGVIYYSDKIYLDFPINCGIQGLVCVKINDQMNETLTILCLKRTA